MKFIFSILFVIAATIGCSAAERILMTRLGPAQSSLFASNADGTGEQKLTEGYLDYNPVWSPDGQWIVFTSERDGSADLYRMHPDGSGLERLTNDPAYDDQAAFSPDGNRIVFVTTRAAGRANLWTLDLNTRQATPLTSGSGSDFRPAWSPDGQWIAFSSDRESPMDFAKGRWEHLHFVDVYLIRPDGSGLKRLSHGNFCGSPKWWADSASVVAYCMPAEDTWTFRTTLRRGGLSEGGETAIVRIDIVTGETRAVDAGPGVKMFPSVLPSGEIAFLRADAHAQGVFYSISKTGPVGDVRWPAWSADGKRVVYGREVFLPPGAPRKLWSKNSEYELFSTGILPAYDRTGERYVATAVAPNRRDTGLLLGVGDSPPKRILESKDELIIAPQWSPLGDTIIFGIGKFASFLDFAIGAKKPVDPANGGAQIAVINADGTGFKKITSGANSNGFPSYSPDGQRIAYRSIGPDGNGLRIMNLKDGSVTPLTEEYDNFPVWSPRGDLIAFVRRFGGDNFDVFTIRPDGSDLRRLTDSRGNDAHLAWSPDGEKIMFSSTRMGFKDEALYTFAPQPYGDLFVMRRDGTQVEQLTDNQWEDAGPAWQPRKD